jgi:hypothetical protein
MQKRVALFFPACYIMLDEVHKSGRSDMTTSRNQQERRLQQRIAALGPILQGCVTSMAVRCGNPNCKCARGEKHRSLCLVVSRQGRTRNMYLGAALAPRAREWIANYRQLMDLVQEWSDLNIERLKADRSRRRKPARRPGGSPR